MNGLKQLLNPPAFFPGTLPSEGKETGIRVAIIVALLFGATSGFAEGPVVLSEEFEETIVENYAFTFPVPSEGAVPDGSPVGWVDAQTIDSAIREITSLTVTLDISADFNGDLYAYLTHDSGFTTLLNRPGRTGDNGFGYGDSGFNVTFDDASDYVDIHNYGESVTLDPGEPLTGTWQPDARNDDPGTVTDLSPRTAFLSSFHGLDASGEWVLYVADMSSGGSTAINSWGMEVTGVIPEPATYTLVLGGIAAALAFCGGKRRKT